MPEILFSLAVALFVVTLLGHGIWVLLAAIFRAITGTTRTRTPRRDCPTCGGRSVVVEGVCRNCGATPYIRSAPEITPRAEDDITRRRLEQLVQDGLLAREDFED